MDPVIAELQGMVQELYAKLAESGRRLDDLVEEANARFVLVEDRLSKMAALEGLEALRLTRLADIERRLDQLEERTGFLS